MKKSKTLKNILDSAPVPPEVPWEVWTKLGSKNVLLFNEQVSFGESDYGTVEQMRTAIEWYVEQFDGIVKWK